jgi:hypothetical protein
MHRNRMPNSDDTDKTTAGAAALSICESLLIALSDLKIIDDKETRAILVDAAESHRRAIPGSSNPDEHRAVAALIDRIIDGKNSAPKF